MKLHCVHVGGWLSWLLIDLGRHTAYYEKHYSLGSVSLNGIWDQKTMRYESKKQGSNDVFVSSLFLSVDVMRLAASVPSCFPPQNNGL